MFALYSVPLPFRGEFWYRTQTKKSLIFMDLMVGVAGFEPATPSSRTR